MSEQAWRILVVSGRADDRAEVRRLLSRGSDRRFEFAEVGTAVAGVRACLTAADPPHCVVIDDGLPDATPPEVLAALRNGTDRLACPVVVLAESPDPGAARAAFRAGVHDYVGKHDLSASGLARVVENAVIRFALDRERDDGAATLRESELFLRQLADASPAMLRGTDPTGRCTFLSAGWYEFTGQAEETGLGYGWLDAVHPDDRSAARGVFVAAVERREPFQVDYRLRRADGEYRWAIDAGRPRFGPSGFLGFVGSVIDITDRKAAEEALREADRRKDEFLATLAHELRNPLAPIRTGLQILKLHPNGEQAEKARGMMERQLGHMVRLVDDLLDISRASQGKMRLRRGRVAVQAVVETAVEASRPLIAEAGHRFAVHTPPERLYLDADPTRIAQVLSNLLNNAAKYTPAGGGIDLTVERQGDDVVLRVRDTGVGIPADDLPRVFDPFAQVGRNLDRAQGGLGIGLALVKRLVAMHGGSVRADSPGVGRGSTFEVRLPLAPSPAPEPQGPAADGGRRAQARRLLVVDDNVDGAESLAMLLAIAGHEVRTAYTGPDALTAAADFRPDAVLLDIGLPGMDGYQVAQRLRQQPDLAGAALVAVTGWGSDADKRRAQDAGFDTHLTKPVDPARVESLLSELPTRTPAT